MVIFQYDQKCIDYIEQEAHGPQFAHLSESHFDTFNINVYGPHK